MNGLTPPPTHTTTTTTTPERLDSTLLWLWTDSGGRSLTAASASKHFWNLLFIVTHSNKHLALAFHVQNFPGSGKEWRLSSQLEWQSDYHTGITVVMETKDGALVLSRPLHIPEHWELVWKCRSHKNKRCDKFRLSDQAGQVWFSWPVCLVWIQSVLFTDKSWCPSLSWAIPTSTQNNKLMYTRTELNLKYNLLIFALLICTFRKLDEHPSPKPKF